MHSTAALPLMKEMPICYWTKPHGFNLSRFASEPHLVLRLLSPMRVDWLAHSSGCYKHLIKWTHLHISHEGCQPPFSTTIVLQAPHTIRSPAAGWHAGVWLGGCWILADVATRAREKMFPTHHKEWHKSPVFQNHVVLLSFPRSSQDVMFGNDCWFLWPDK